MRSGLGVSPYTLGRVVIGMQRAGWSPLSSCFLASPTHQPLNPPFREDWVRPPAMSDSEVSSTGGESTPASSSVPSPELFKLTLADLKEESKEKAVKIKAEANQAFVGTFRPAIPPQSSVTPVSGIFAFGWKCRHLFRSIPSFRSSRFQEGRRSLHPLFG